MGKRENYVVGQGETFVLDLVFTDSNGSPLNLKRANLALVVMKSKVGTPIGTYIGKGFENGRATFKVAKEVTATWPAGKNAYLVVRQQGADQFWLQYGALIVRNGADV